MNVLTLFKSITTFVFDVDGVLTDGTLLVMQHGLMVRRMNIKDGFALQLAVKKNYHLLVVSGGFSEEVKERLYMLGVQNVFMRIENKKALVEDYLLKNNLLPEQTLFMGDDIPDYKVMKFAGLPCCPRDAAGEIKAIAKYISPYKGGEGCARDVIEKVLKLQRNWQIDTTIKSQ